MTPVIGLVEDLAGRRGILVAGPGSGPADAVSRVAGALGWPVFAAPQSDVWADPCTIPAVDALLRGPVDLQPEVVVHLGGPVASRVVGEWLAGSGAAQIVVAGDGAWVDPHGTAVVLVAGSPEAVVEAWALEAGHAGPVDGGAWAARWQELGHTAQQAVDGVLDDAAPTTEPRVAREVVSAMPPDARLVVSSSMPIRDVEWYVRPEAPVEVHANRGANGIDGVVSTGVGLALSDRGRATVLLIGDLALLHDSNGLLGAAARGIDLVVVVVDNDGGGIFSFLPQAEVVDTERFEQLYGTPHGIDLVALCAAYGADASDTDDVGPAVAAALAAGGLHVLVVRTDRASNVAVHRRLNAAVSQAVAAALDGRVP